MIETRLVRDERGFSFTELMVALLVSGMLMLATVGIYSNAMSLFLIESNRAEAQQAARVALSLQEDLRLIGGGVPGAQAKITAASATAITFVGDTRGASTLLSTAVNAGATTLSVNGTVGIYSGDTVNLINGATWQSVVAGAVTANSITVAPALTSAYPIGTQVGVPRTITYSYNAATRTLSRDAGDGGGLLAVATGVSNFQLTYYNANNVVDNTLASIRRISVTITTQSAMSLDQQSFTINSDVRPRNL